MKNDNNFIKKMIRLSFVEFIGTFVLVFAGCGAIAVSQLNPSIGSLGISVTFGLAVTCIIYATGHLSGAHINPAVTLSFAINRHFPAKLILPYIIAQCLGAIFACYLLYYTLLPIFEVKQVLFDIGVTQPAIDSIWLAFSWEFIMTFILMFVITSVATDSRAVGEMAGISIGAAVCLCALIGNPITGASMNPARSLGPALVSGQFQYLYIYFIAPILGAIVAGYLYGILCPECEQCDKKFPIL